MQMYVISDNNDTYMGFRLAGVDGIVCHEKGEVQKAIDFVLSNNQIGILLITEKLACLCEETVDKIKRDKNFPLFVTIPDRHGFSRRDNPISKYIEQAIGIKL